MDEETFLFDSKKEGLAKVILAIIRYAKVNQNLSQEAYNKEINRKLKLPKYNSDRLLCYSLIQRVFLQAGDASTFHTKDAIYPGKIVEYLAS
ncbi:hypothetical protein [Mucilaginibacter paludis]|uniref:Uncharacterized protein n=1 Tax=Mucilaginibacter paludis DSM 18603 TaxID=714943 RepID=H1Y6A2_9SPHI|nr:hypothetical protein [Mucilaginibacter paludis]EHQ24850.1 hypothetical protein Mucpa_0664 [Mucilaginibacter paludis DSM 18603]